MENQQSPTPGPPGKGRRATRWFVIGIISFFALLVSSAFIFPYVAPPFIEKEVVRRLNDLGIRHAQLKISDIGRSGIAIEGFELGGDRELQVASLSMSLSWLDLFVGKIAALEISGFRLHLQLLEDGSLSFGALSPLFQDSVMAEPNGEAEDGIAAALVVWPIKSVRLVDAEIKVASTVGDLILPFEGILTQRDDGTVSLDKASVTFKSKEITVDGVLSGTLNRSGLLNADLQVGKGNIDFGFLAAHVAHGRIAVTGNMQDVSSFAAEGEVQVQASRAPLSLKPKSKLIVQLQQGTLKTSFSVDDEGSQLAGNVEIQMDRLFSDDPSVSTNVSLRASDLSKLPRHPMLIEGLKGNATTRLSFSERMSALLLIANQQNPSGLLNIAPEVQLAITAENVEHAGSGLVMSMDGELTLLRDEGSLKAVSPRGISMTVSEAEGTVFAKLLGPFFDNNSTGDFRYRLENGDQPLIEAVATGDDHVQVSTSGQMTVQGGGLPHMNGQFLISALSGPKGMGLETVTVRKLEIFTSAAQISGGVFEVKRMSLTGNGTPDTFTGDLKLDAGLSGEIGTGLVVDNGNVSLSFDLAYENGAAVVHMNDCSTLLVDRIAFSEKTMLAGPIDICIEGDNSPVVRVDMGANGEVVAGAYSVLARSKLRRMDIDAVSGQKIVIRGPNMAAQFGGRIPTSGKPASLEVRVDGVNVVLPAEHFSAEGLSLKASTDAGDPLAHMKANLRIAAIRHHQQPKIFNSLSMVTEIEGQSAEKLALSGRLQNKTGELVVEFDGVANSEFNNGDITFRSRPFKFGPGEAHLNWIFPVLGPYLSQARGMLMTAARAQWMPEGFKVDGDVVGQGLNLNASLPNPSGENLNVKARGSQVAVKIRLNSQNDVLSKRGLVLLENINVEAKGAELEKVNAVINFADLWPLKTKGTQEISIASASVGVPLTNGRINFSIPEENAIKVEGLAFELAQGSVSADPFQLKVGKPLPPINMKIKDVSLGNLVEQFDDEKLSAEGVLHGNFPIIEKDGVFLISKGRLTGEPGGRISYVDPDATEIGAGLGTVTSILENFQYDKLQLDVDGQVDGTIKVQASISGRNEDYLDGFPVELSLGLTGRVAEILGSSAGNYQVPETIKDRILQFSQ